MDLIVAQQIVVKVPESSGGASTESIFVFIGGVLAAIAAVAAALITTKGASSRLADQLDSERVRFDKQLAAEGERLKNQSAHEQYLMQRAEASSALEQIIRLVARNAADFNALHNSLGRSEGLDQDLLEKVADQIQEMRVEISVIAMRFGNESPVVEQMVNFMAALFAGSQALRDARKDRDNTKDEEVDDAVQAVNRATAQFVGAARDVLERY